jgi:hypothetical protein
LTTDDSTQEKTTYGPLLVNAAQAGDLAERLVGWYLFPASVSGATKRPMTPSWQSYAATGREAVTSLWERFAGFNEDGTPASTAVGVACDPSGIFVIDEDRDWRSDEASPDSNWQEWATAIDSCHSLILRSSTKGRPHYYFRQPSDGPRVAERVWIGGEVKSKGFVVLGSSEPIYQPSSAGGGLWTPQDVKEAIPPLVDLVGRRREDASDGSEYRNHRVTKEEFYDWLDTEPGEHFGGRLISEEYEQAFVDRLVDKFKSSVERNTARREACRNAVHQATIESYQGLYSLRTAYDALLDAYEEMRTYGPGDCTGEKGWTKQRQDDYHSMWETEIHKPDALRSAEESYDEVVERLSSSGRPMEVSEEDRENDAYCMEVIFTASNPNAEPAPPETDELSWDDIPVDEPAPEPPNDAPAPTTTSPVVAASPVVLQDAAKRGPLWDMCSGLIGQHELPHEALMITMAAWTGAVLGSAGAGAMFIGEDRHGPELCVCMVGTSAVAHKSGTVGFGHMVYDEFVDAMETGVSAPGFGSGFFREVSGIESGQAFIEIWPTAADIAGGEGIGRAVIMVEKELTTMWKKAARKGSTIPEEIRKAWDGDMLTVRGIRAGNHRVLPANYRFSAVGATIHGLAAKTIIESGADISGDGNRWLWCWGQEVPEPVKGTPSFKDHPLVQALRQQVSGVVKSVEAARTAGWWPGSAPAQGGRPPVVEFGEPHLWWTEEADQAWLGDQGGPNQGKGVYADLSNELRTNAPGSFTVKQLKGRGAQQVMRLALQYEMLRSGENWAHLVRSTKRSDGRSWCISLEALNWANAVWRFCADTVEHLFADTTGDNKIDELVLAITEIGRDMGAKFNGYVLKSDVVGSGFAKNQVAALIAQAENQGAIWTGTLRREGRGGQPIVIGLPKWNPPPEVNKRRPKT